MLDARIVKVRRDFTVDITLAIAADSSVGLFGPSGAGKSTALSCIAGFETPDDGHVRFGERTFFPPALPLAKRNVGYLTQEASLFPHLTVAQNVGFGPRGRDAEWIAELRDRLRLEAVWKSPAARISGGQARRVALARMLAPKPPLILLDEPFAGLDRDVVRELLADLSRWRRDIGATLIAVDHDADILERLTERAIAIEGGVIVAQAPWAQLRAAPATPLLRALLDPI